jgi:hypothetical protein
MGTFRRRSAERPHRLIGGAAVFGRSLRYFIMLIFCAFM